MTDQAAPVARLIFTGERFVSLPRLATLLNDVVSPHRPMRFEEVTLTHLRLRGDRLSLRLDLAFEDGGPEVSVTILHGADDPEGTLASLTYALVSRIAVAHIVWPGSALRIPRDQFLESLSDILGAPRKASDGVAPRRIARPIDRHPAQRSRPAARPAADPHDRIDRYANAMGGVRATDRRYDAHVMAFEAAMRNSLRAEPAMQTAPDAHALPVEARLATWAMSLSAATIALPVAIPIMAWNLVKGEDMRAAALSVGIAGFVFSLDHSGAMAAAF
ncbi:hypothetical protein [Thetidibacter halocola]|uniref:Uncharacterized protein n=1 Tax=Thetidibacter halocola TaxID=2827239 RepID=A0A8J7WEC6_9RHOB|nr:hypothetical protein [Thetidibacter halocola]MBS0124161.1 hypothetical protein [Thetidibacter halocola]